jgi:hypothetical protein
VGRLFSTSSDADGAENRIFERDSLIACYSAREWVRLGLRSQINGKSSKGLDSRPTSLVMLALTPYCFAKRCSSRRFAFASCSGVMLRTHFLSRTPFFNEKFLNFPRL